MIPVLYCTGMRQPAKSTIFPPWPSCQSCSTVLLNVSLMRHPYGVSLMAVPPKADSVRLCALETVAG